MDMTVPFDRYKKGGYVQNIKIGDKSGRQRHHAVEFLSRACWADLELRRRNMLPRSRPEGYRKAGWAQ